MKSYAQYKKEIGKHPDFTCPFINSAIDQLEKLREQNDSLRIKLHEWMDAVKEISQSTQDQKKQIRKLKSQINKLKISQEQKSKLKSSIDDIINL